MIKTVMDTEDALEDILGYRKEELDSTSFIELYRGNRDTVITVEHDTFGWLAERLEYDPEMDAAYQDFCETVEEIDTAHKLFGPWYAEKMGAKFDGPYWKGDGVVDVITTSVGNNSLLTWEVTMAFWNHDGHGYAIVKHGYHDNGHVFRPGGISMDLDSLLEFMHASIVCVQCNLSYTNRNHGSKFEVDDVEPFPYSEALVEKWNQLPKYLDDVEDVLSYTDIVHPDEWTDEAEENLYVKGIWPPEYPKFPGEDMDPLFPEEIAAQKEAFDPRAHYEFFGTIVTDENDTPHCPCCGGRLVGSSY